MSSSSAGPPAPIEGPAVPRPTLPGRALLRASARPEGTGAPSPRRGLRATFAVLALATFVLALTAAPALAAPPSVTAPVVSEVSYATVHLTGTITSDGTPPEGGFGDATSFAFQYSTDPSDPSKWVAGFETNFGTVLHGKFTDEPVGATINLPKGGTEYFVRIVANHGFFLGAEPVVASPAPYPSFTTLAVDPPAIPGPVGTSSVFSTSATAGARVKRPAGADPAFDVSCRFEYIADGEYGVQRDEVQELTVGAEGGTFQLEYEGQKTSPIAFDASAASVQAALEALPGFPPGSLTVTGGPGDQNATNPYILSFGGSLADRNVALVRSDGAQLQGSTTAVNVSTATDGRAVGFEGATVRQCLENPVTAAKVDGAGEAEVSAPLGCLSPLTEAPSECLAPETTYHLRLLAENAAPGVVVKEAASTFTSEPRVAKPSVLRVDDATDVSYGSAKVSGEVSRPAGTDTALDVACRFEYVTDEQFLANVANSLPGFEGASAVACAENPITASSVDGEGKEEVGAELSGLLSRSGVTYHLRLLAENGGGLDAKDAADTFTTLPGGESSAVIDAPVVGYTTAHVSGSITRGVLDEGVPLNPFFEYAEAGTGNWSGPGGERLLGGVPSGPGPFSVSYEFTGLTPGTEYEFRLNYQRDGTGQEPAGPYPHATTRALAVPSVVLDPITDITGTSAHLTGIVDTQAPAGPLDDLAKAAYRTEWRIECMPACPGPGGKPFSGIVQGEEGSKPIRWTSPASKAVAPTT